MFRSFLICLSPSILAYGIMIVGMMSGSKFGSSDWISLVVILLGAGAVLSGACVGRHVFRKTGEPVFLKWFLAVLTFLGVGVVYFVIATAGCCGIAVVGDSF